MIRRLPRRATTEPIVTAVGLPGGSIPVFGVPGRRKGSGMCIPGLRGHAAAGTDPARLALIPRNATSPGNVTCPRWRQHLSLHPLSPGTGTGLPEQPRSPDQPCWKGTLWSSAFSRGAPSGPG